MLTARLQLGCGGDGGGEGADVDELHPGVGGASYILLNLQMNLDIRLGFIKCLIVSRGTGTNVVFISKPQVATIFATYRGPMGPRL